MFRRLFCDRAKAMIVINDNDNNALVDVYDGVIVTQSSPGSTVYALWAVAL